MWAVQYHPEYDLQEVARLIEARDEKLIKLGFFKDLAALKDYTGRLDALVAEPDRKDLRWQLGIDEDIMDDGIRELEFANWVKHFFG
jgi:GMP synthase (glutamine-hydrolysing)